MSKIILMLTMLLVGGLSAGAAFAQDVNVMSLTPGRVDAMSLMPDIECLSEIDFEELGLSEALMFPSIAALYGFDMAGGGLSDGSGDKVPMFCTYNWGYESCGSCLPTSRGKRRIRYKEWWCIGIRVWRSEKCVYCPF